MLLDHSIDLFQVFMAVHSPTKTLRDTRPSLADLIFLQLSPTVEDCRQKSELH